MSILSKATWYSTKWICHNLLSMFLILCYDEHCCNVAMHDSLCMLFLHILENSPKFEMLSWKLSAYLILLMTSNLHPRSMYISHPHYQHRVEWLFLHSLFNKTCPQSHSWGSYISQWTFNTKCWYCKSSWTSHLFTRCFCFFSALCLDPISSLLQAFPHVLEALYTLL